jgi:hypothetical protein
LLAEGFHVKLGQEAEFAEIDTQERDVKLGSLASLGQKGAIATKDNEQIGTFLGESGGLSGIELGKNRTVAFDEGADFTSRGGGLGLSAIDDEYDRTTHEIP